MTHIALGAIISGMINRSDTCLRFIDLFCGIGGFRYAVEGAAAEKGVVSECVLSSDIDVECQKAYSANFNETPTGDIHKITDIPDHDLLVAGFPCQPFSIIGKREGFDDARGTLFFEIARILEAKRPQSFVLENVKLLAGHNKGKTLSRILEVLRELGYQVDWRIFNALDFGLPQKRERVFIVGFREPRDFEWPLGGMAMTPLEKILEKNVPEKYFASDYIRRKRLARHEPREEATIWHENKAGNISVYPYSCALRAGASYNYLLVNGERRLTPREMLRLQGFPDSFKIVCNYSQTRKQAGNSLPVPVARAILEKVLDANGWKEDPATEYPEFQSFDGQLTVFEGEAKNARKTKITNRRKVQSTLSIK